MLTVLVRWGGLAGAAGGVLFAIWGYVHRDGAPSYFAMIANALALVVPMLFLAALVGLYARCKEGTGWLSGLGFILGSIGCARGVFDAVAGDPSRHLYAVGLGWTAPLLEWLFLVLVGLALMGIATMRAPLQGLSIPPLVIGFFGFAYSLTDSGSLFEARVAHMVCGILFSTTWVVVGILLWSEKRRHDTKSSDSVLHHH
jgi:hypothetical protein